MNQNVWNDFIALFYPNICLICDKPVIETEKFICVTCFLSMARVQHETCGENDLLSKFAAFPKVTLARSFLEFHRNGAAQQLVHAFKYEGHKMLAHFLGKLMASDSKSLFKDHHWDFIIPVPRDSLHFTLADLIWDNAYGDAKETNPDFEAQLQSCFSDIFQQYRKSGNPKNPPRWQMLGLMLMPRAIAVCLVPLDRDSYEQIVNLRRAIYQNPKLIALGIEQQYNFTAHITLGYFGEIPSDLNRNNFATMLSEQNQKWTENLLTLMVHRAELRKFDDMTRFYRESDFPALVFSS